MVSQTVIKALNNIQAQLIKIAGLGEDQLGQIRAIISNNTQPKIKGMGKKTGYILFSMTERKMLKENGELEGLSFGDVARLLGKNWRESSQDIKDKWNTEAKDHNKNIEPVKPTFKSDTEVGKVKSDTEPDSEDDIQNPVDSDDESAEEVFKKVKRVKKRSKSNGKKKQRKSSDSDSDSD